MNVQKKQICRLCLDVADTEFDEIAGEMLKVLLIEVEWSIIENPTICEICTTIIKRLFYFKSVCVHTEKLIASFAINKKGAEFELKDIVHIKGGTEMILEENFRCRFCMNGIKSNNFVSIEVLMEETYKDVLSALMPEMDIDIVKNPTVCIPCKKNMECYSMFLRNVLDIESKINTFYQNIDSSRSGRIKLDDILHCLFSDNIQQPNKRTCMYANRRQLTTFEELDKVYSCGLMKIEEILHIKDEEVLNENSYKQTLEIVVDEDKHVYGRNNNFVQSSVYSECDMYNRVNKVNEKSMVYATKCKQSLKQPHEDLSGIDMYRCLLCPYKTTLKDRLKKHQLVHKDASEVTMYKCELCTYATKYKSALQNHGLTHKDPSEVNIHLCPSCPYKTKLKGRLKKHMLVHMDVSEVETYKCELCPYVTKYKSALHEHALTHKDASEVDMYKCSLCPYRTKWKRYLKNHIILHQDASEVDMYKCSHCPYETKLRDRLHKHLLVHKDTSEVEMYKCELCTYSTKYKGTLQRHALIHKDASEVETFKCASCMYATKYKRTLELHALTHKDVSETKMYKCLLCPYETKWKNQLKGHGLSHKDASELEMYKCSVCCFQTRRKHYVKQHMLTHKGASELEMYKCAVCAFETKYKSSLKKHVLTRSHSVPQK